jgi:beta-galactosidase/beta-glucuronidase
VVGAGGGRTILHFGAIDWQSTIFVNGHYVANHTGGYDAIDLDISEALATSAILPAAAEHELLVYVYDPSLLGDQPNGKQNSNSIHNPGGGQYTPSSGIWQTVWLEAVPAAFISSLSLQQNSTNTVAISAAVEGIGSPQQRGAPTTSLLLSFSVVGGSTVIATGTGAPGAVVSLTIPSPRLWGPGAPNLYDVKVTLHNAAPAASGTKALDEVVGYFGLRSVRLGKQQGHNVTRPLLNGKFTFLAGWLDQSWWPDGQYTAPTDAALASDVRAVPMFGLNLVRLHMKVNPERWYYHADRAGVVVFQDMVQKICTTHCTPKNLAYYLADLSAMIAGRKNHPSIVQFTLLNEADMWQLFDTKPYDLSGLLHFARGLAPDHWINLESGANVAYDASGAGHLGDVVDCHTYPAPSVRPNASASQYAMLGEFGGVGAFVVGKEWRPPTPTHKSCFAYNLPLVPLATPADEAQAYIKMTDTLLSWSDTLSASVYTQISDVELECDGFLNYDRTNKFGERDTAAIKEANLRLTRPK